MSIQLNHTIVHSRNAEEASAFLAEMLGLEPPAPFYHFYTVQLANGVTLDFMDAGADAEIAVQHYAFLVEETEFDAIFGRIRERGLEYWADPLHNRPNEINRNDGGRGVYFNDLSGHYLEIITKPYGSGG